MIIAELIKSKSSRSQRCRGNKYKILIDNLPINNKSADDDFKITGAKLLDNPFQHTGNQQQMTLKISRPKYGKSLQMMI